MVRDEVEVVIEACVDEPDAGAHETGIVPAVEQFDQTRQRSHEVEPDRQQQVRRASQR